LRVGCQSEIVAGAGSGKEEREERHPFERFHAAKVSTFLGTRGWQTANLSVIFLVKNVKQHQESFYFEYLCKIKE
jgi:hypothetical protein